MVYHSSYTPRSEFIAVLTICFYGLGNGTEMWCIGHYITLRSCDAKLVMNG